MNHILALAVIGISLLPPQPPDPPKPPESILTIPAGTIPWALPKLPSAEIDLDVGEVVFNEVEHSDEYADNLAEIQANIGSLTGDVGTTAEDAETELDTWFGIGGLIPDITQEDFDTGISVPGYEDMSMNDIATEMGSDVGTMFSYIRGLAQAGVSLGAELGGMGYLIAFVVLCVAWMAFVIYIKFAIQLIDMLVSATVLIVDFAIKIADFFIPLN